MANISHIGNIKQSEFISLLTNADDPKTNDYNVEESDIVNSNADIITIGIGDSGISIKEKLSDLITYRNNGGNILFFHDCPKRLDCYVSLDDEDDNYLVFNSEINSLGLSGLEEISSYNFYSNFNKAIPDHAVMSNYFDLSGIDTTISTTHNIGLSLVDAADIVLNDGGTAASKHNYYLACIEEVDLGKICFFNFGHNQYDVQTYNDTNQNESRILVNALEWLIS